MMMMCLLSSLLNQPYSSMYLMIMEKDSLRLNLLSIRESFSHFELDRV